MDLSTVIKYYKRPEVQQAIYEAGIDREVAISYKGQGYGKRPDILAYPRDVLSLVQKGGTSFHCSEEIWTRPLQIVTGAPKKELNALRKGWDLILDIDCPHLDYSRVAGHLLVQAIYYHDIKSVSVKFSGNHGFHIGVPFKSFPNSVNNQPISELFPDGPRAIAGYLKDFIRAHLAAALKKIEDIEVIAKNVGKTKEELVKDGQFDPFEVLDIDTILIASRHLYRMPYSINEKSGLVSIPIKNDEIMTMPLNDAEPENVYIRTFRFLDDKNTVPGEAAQLLLNSFDAKAVEDAKQKEAFAGEFKGDREFTEITEPLPEESFPPCIKLILNGLEDGKKRGMFILVNFLRSVGWKNEDIQKLLTEWNEKHPEPVRETILQGHLRHHLNKKDGVMPPNCENKMYYHDLRVCQPENLCQKIKNPVNFAVVRSKGLAIAQKQKEREEKQAKNYRKKKEKEAQNRAKIENKETNTQPENNSDNNITPDDKNQPQSL